MEAACMCYRGPLFLDMRAAFREEASSYVVQGLGLWGPGLSVCLGGLGWMFKCYMRM